jgi:aspartyl-tRNA(Asn)/glutamyl-tRNA(Gln) amidotransferase subunit B
LSDKKIVQETRLYDPDKNRTFSMRLKEDAQDYRYFIDPDLLPIIVTAEKINEIKTQIPELPIQKSYRFVSDLGLSAAEAEVLTSDKKLALYFEETAKLCNNSKLAANWILGEVLRCLNESNEKIQHIKITPQHLSELIHLVENKTVSGKIAKTVFTEMMQTGTSANLIINQRGYKQVTDVNELEKIIQSVVDANPNQVAEYQSGKEKLFSFFIGQADPDAVTEILKKVLTRTKT